MYGVPTPAEVDAVAVAEQSDERTIDDIFNDLTDWATACEDRERYEQARQQRARTRGGLSVFDPISNDPAAGG